MNTEDNTMAGGSFLTVGEDGTTTLAELSVDGYDKDIHWDEEEGGFVGGCQGSDFMLNVVTPTGSSEAIYIWQHYMEGDDEQSGEMIGPGWFEFDEETSAITPVADPSAIEFDAGQAFWIAAPNGKKLVSAGQVTKKDIEFETEPIDNTAVANGTAAALNLGRLTVDGYDKDIHWDEEEGGFVGGCQGSDFMVNVLTPTGSSEHIYLWQHYMEGDDEQSGEMIGPGWFEFDEATSEITPLSKEGMAAIPVNPGQGFWISGNGKTIIFPAVEGL